MKKLKDLSKSLASLDSDKLLSNELRNIKGGSVPSCDSCKESCSPGCSVSCASGGVTGQSAM